MMPPEVGEAPRCPHGRPSPYSCPHCLGLNAAPPAAMLGTGGGFLVSGHADQPMPAYSDEGPCAQDLVIRDLTSRDLRWDLSYGAARRIRDLVCEDLDARKKVGLERYGTLLRPHNGRDMLRDLYEELMDASAYARARLMEAPEDGLEWPLLAEVYDRTVTDMVLVRRLMLASSVLQQAADRIDPDGPDVTSSYRRIPMAGLASEAVAGNPPAGMGTTMAGDEPAPERRLPGASRPEG